MVVVTGEGHKWSISLLLVESWKASSDSPDLEKHKHED